MQGNSLDIVENVNTLASTGDEGNECGNKLIGVLLGIPDLPQCFVSPVLDRCDAALKKVFCGCPGMFRLSVLFADFLPTSGGVACQV